MVLPILQYGHPALRQKGARIDAITPALEKLVEDMFETMYAAAGIGLAAPQVGQALQLTVLDLRAVKDRPSTLERDGRPADPDGFMPLVLLNPQLKPFGEQVAGPEGCLSFPEVYADVVRPEFVEVSAWNAQGQTITFKAGGLLARAIQHETDHLNGILFIDRMTAAARAPLQTELDALQAASKAALKKEREKS